MIRTPPPRPKPRAWRPVLLAALLLAACSDGGASAEPVPGELTLRLATPNGDDRALLLSVSGPGTIGAVTAANPGVQVHAGPAGGTVRVAVFGQITTGNLLRLSVSDVREASGYGVVLLEAAGPNNRLRNSLNGYSVTFAR